MTSPSSSKSRAILAAISSLSFVGLALSAYLTQHFYLLRFGIEEGISLCNFGGRFNCDSVAGSMASETLFRIPLSAVALFWFLVIFALSILARDEARRNGLVKIMTVGAIFATLSSVFYLYVMVAVLKTYCPFCLGIDVVNVSTLVLLLVLRPFSSPQGRGQWGIAMATALLALAVTAGSTKMLYESVQPTPAQIDEMIQKVLDTPPTVINVNNALRFGRANTPVEVVEFIDFKCPHCRIASHMLHDLTTRYPEKVHVIVKNFPLDPVCNSLMPEGFPSTGTCEVARAAVCASKQGHFEAMYQGLFAQQLFLNSDRVKLVAQSIGLDMKVFDACMQAPETSQAVLDDIADGKTLDLQGTPTFFVNGHRVNGALPPRAFEALVNKLAR